MTSMSDEDSIDPNDDDDENLFSSSTYNKSVFDHMSTVPMKGFKPNFTQHIMTKRGSLFTSDNTNITDDDDVHISSISVEKIKYDENHYPDLLDLPQFNQNYYENYFNSYSTLPITKTVNSTNYSRSKLKSKINSDDSQASLLSSSSNDTATSSALTKFIPSTVKLHSRRFSVDSYSYIPQSSSLSSSSSFSLMTTTTTSAISKQNFNKQRSNSYLNLVAAPDASTKCLKTYPSLPSSPLNSSTTTKQHSALNNSGVPGMNVNSVSNLMGGGSNYITSNKTLGIPSNATPLLDFSSLPIHTRISSSFIENPSASSKLLYDYHTTQLEYFIQEYRKLQQQLKKIGGLSIPSPMSSSGGGVGSGIPPISNSSSLSKDTVSPIGQSAKFADPLMYNEAWLASTTTSTTSGINMDGNVGGIGCGGDILKNQHHASQQSNLSSMQQHHQPLQPSTITTTSILKKKQLVNWNKSPDPPPYWLHRNAMIKQLNNNPATAPPQPPPLQTTTSATALAQPPLSQPPSTFMPPQPLQPMSLSCVTGSATTATTCGGNNGNLNNSSNNKNNSSVPKS